MVSESLKFINAIVGFCSHLESWPHPLADLGYVACGVEREIKVRLGGQLRTVVVDLICASPSLNHALCAETKSRAVNLDQARKYQVMTSSNLLNMANLPTGVAGAVLTHDVVYITSNDNAEAVSKALNEASIPMPVVQGGPEGFALHQGTISLSQLHQLFFSGISLSVDPIDWPLSFVPFTFQSSDSELVAIVAQTLSLFLIGGRDFSVEEFANQMLPNWKWFGQRQQIDLRRRFSRLADNAMENELKGYYQRQHGHQRWTVMKGPLKPPNQTARLSDLVEEFVNRIQQDIPRQKQLPGI